MTEEKNIEQGGTETETKDIDRKNVEELVRERKEMAEKRRQEENGSGIVYHKKMVYPNKCPMHTHTNVHNRTQTHTCTFTLTSVKNTDYSQLN